MACWSTSPHCTSCSMASTSTTTRSMTWPPSVNPHSQRTSESRASLKKLPIPAVCGVVQGAGAAKPARKGVETGGAPVNRRSDVSLAVAGAALLLVSAALLFSVARVRGDSCRGPLPGQTHQMSLHLRRCRYACRAGRRCEGLRTESRRPVGQPLISSTRALDITPVSGSSRRSR